MSLNVNLMESNTLLLYIVLFQSETVWLKIMKLILKPDNIYFKTHIQKKTKLSWSDSQKGENCLMSLMGQMV